MLYSQISQTKIMIVKKKLEISSAKNEIL